jgi:hypothetical protein
MNMGLSAKHSSTVPLVLNTETGSITTAFHVVFDDWFATIATTVDDLPDFNSDSWSRLFGDSRFQYVVDDTDVNEEIDVDPTTPASNARRDNVGRAMDNFLHPGPLPVPAPPSVVVPSSTNTPSMPVPIVSSPPSSTVDVNLPPLVPRPVTPMSLTREISPTREQLPLLVPRAREPSLPHQRETSTWTDQSGSNTVGQPLLDQFNKEATKIQSPKVQVRNSPAKKDHASAVLPSISAPNSASPRRSGRVRRAPPRFGHFNQVDFSEGYLQADFNLNRIPTTCPNMRPSTPCPTSILPSQSPDDDSLEAGDTVVYRTFAATMATISPSFEGKSYLVPSTYFAAHFSENSLPMPLTFKARINNPDTLNYDEAFAHSDNAAEWRKAACKEIEGLEGKDTWVEVDFNEAKTKILPGTWIFVRKRTPDGTISKYKARYCLRGDLEEDDGENHTSPVVSWPSVRLFLVFSMWKAWYTCSIDFTNAFVQAKLPIPIWIHLPRGFRSNKPYRTCLRLEKSLYGLVRAPRLWFEHILRALKLEGFCQSQYDPCFLFKPGMMLVMYVDDCGIAAANIADIQRLIASLRKRGFELTQEGSFAEFLGIKLEEDTVQKTILLTQRGLIKKVIAATGLEDCKPNWTPAASNALGLDPDGAPMDETWSYPSIVGMLLYLSTNTRPDISFAVSQAARFSHNPKQSHATAVKTIIRYLHRTSDKGTIVKLSNDLFLNCYVDADFAGLYRQDPDRSISSAKSRTGYIILLGGVPLVWRSHLQTEISLSTLESEYSALSSSMRSLIPLLNMLEEVATAISLNANFRATISSRVFEDNNGALTLANTQRLTSRTKYFHVKMHFFWSYVIENRVIVCRISTDLQQADYLTKGLVRELFERIRRLNQGW